MNELLMNALDIQCICVTTNVSIAHPVVRSSTHSYDVHTCRPSELMRCKASHVLSCTNKYVPCEGITKWSPNTYFRATPPRHLQRFTQGISPGDRPRGSPPGTARDALRAFPQGIAPGDPPRVSPPSDEVDRTWMFLGLFS